VGLIGIKVWICNGEIYGKRDLSPYIIGLSTSQQGGGFRPSRGEFRGERRDRGERGERFERGERGGERNDRGGRDRNRDSGGGGRDRNRNNRGGGSGGGRR